MASNYADTVFDRLNHATVTGLVSTRITPSKPVQEPTGNYLCFWRDSGDFGLNLDGALSCQWINFTLEATAANQAQAEAIMTAARARLHGWRDLTVGVQVCAAQGDANEQTLDDGRETLSQSFSVRWKAL